jgi:hypothetical protein
MKDDSIVEPNMHRIFLIAIVLWCVLIAVAVGEHQPGAEAPALQFSVLRDARSLGLRGRPRPTPRRSNQSAHTWLEMLARRQPQVAATFA